MTIAPERPGADAVLRFARNTRSRQLWDTVQLLLKEIKKMRAYGHWGIYPHIQRNEGISPHGNLELQEQLCILMI